MSADTISTVDSKGKIGDPFRDSTLTLASVGGGASLSFHPDGTVTAKYLDADDAARALIAVLIDQGWLKYTAIGHGGEVAP